MTKQGLLVLLMVLGLFFGLVGLAVFVGRQSQARGVSGGTFRTQKSMRSTVAPMLSKTQKRMDSGTSEGSSDGSDSTVKVQVSQELVEEVLSDALEAPSPELGIEQLERYLQRTHDPAQDSQIHSGIAELQLRVVPPNTAQARIEMSAALELAQSLEDRQRAAFIEAGILQLGGHSEEARLCLEKGLAESDENITITGLRLGILAGSLAEDAKDFSAAKAAYSRVIQQAAAAPETIQKEALNSYRLASLRMIQLYRKTGRANEADAFLQRVETELQTISRSQDLAETYNQTSE